MLPIGFLITTAWVVVGTDTAFRLPPEKIRAAAIVYVAVITALTVAYHLPAWGYRI